MLDTDDTVADTEDEQIMVVSSWMCMREIVLSMGAWMLHVPLPCDGTDGLITMAQLHTMADMYMWILSATKHGGIIDKANIGWLQMTQALMATK